jgi:hypothetical protein
MLSFAQHEISLLDSQSSFRLVKNKQRLLFKSFYARISAVRDCADKMVFFPIEKISSRQKFRIVSFLYYQRNFFYHYRFYIIKNANISFSFNFFSFYKHCFSLLLKITILPFMEARADNSFVTSRFIENNSDFFVLIKSVLLRNLTECWYFKITFLIGLNHLANEWLFKNFPLDTRFLKNFLKVGNFIFDYSSFLLIFNYLFNGLVRITW